MNIDIVIPIRYVDNCDEEGRPRCLLQGKPLWAYTLEQAAAARGIRRIVVAYDDERFLQHLEAWQGRFTPHKRPPFLGLRGVTTLDVLAHVSQNTAPEAMPEYWMLLEITHPLRPPGIIDRLVDAITAQPADSLVTVHPVHYNYWRRDESGQIVRISGSGDSADSELYQEVVGVCSLFRPQFLGSGNPFGDKVDMVPIRDFWSIVDARDADGLWLAEACLNRKQCIS